MFLWVVPRQKSKAVYVNDVATILAIGVWQIKKAHNFFRLRMPFSADVT